MSAGETSNVKSCADVCEAGWGKQQDIGAVYWKENEQNQLD
jgi:hypothetical protein